MAGVHWQEVAAFIGPLIAAMVAMGLFIGWLMKRTTTYVQAQLTAVQNLTNERIANLTEQLTATNRSIERMQLEQGQTAQAVARIEGRLSAVPTISSPKGSEPI